MNEPTADELAAAVREERLEFAEALLRHLELRHPEHHGIEAFLVLSMALGYVSMGEPGMSLEMAGETATSAEWVQRFGLEPFLDAA